MKTSGKWGPLPAPFPWPLGSAFRTEPRTGFPVRPDCAKHGWPDYYAAAETGQAFAALWTNRDGLLDAWAGMWAKVAERFKGNPAVLGLELMNEPFPGDVWSHPTELLPFWHRNGEALNMLPAYEALSAAIAAVDPDRLGEYMRPRGEGRRTDTTKKVFFAGMTWDTSFHGAPQFTRSPAANGVLAYHCTSPVAARSLACTDPGPRRLPPAPAGAQFAGQGGRAPAAAARRRGAPGDRDDAHGDL